MKTYDVDCGEFIARVEYTPERPAPRCSNHDDPAFSDPGDSEEFEIIDVFRNGEKINNLIDQLDAWDKVYEIARERFVIDDTDDGDYTYDDYCEDNRGDD